MFSINLKNYKMATENCECAFEDPRLMFLYISDFPETTHDT